jgi:hypothetical protein
MSIISLDEGEVICPHFPPTHKDEEMIIISDTNDLVEDHFDVVDQHIDDFIHFGRCRWGVGCIIFYEDPIYNVEGSSQAKEFELLYSEGWSPCVYDSNVWKPDDDMVTDLFCPFEDDFSQHTQGDL